MVTITINGKTLQAEEGTTILKAANDNNIFIPSLCDAEALMPYGACRLCLAEIQTARGRKRVVTSCLYPVEDGLIVETNTERIVEDRKVLMELLLARCSNLDPVREMAARLGVVDTPYRKEDSSCILCGLCVRACQEAVGVSAISLVNRGVNRQVASPFYMQSDACIGCGSCAYVCPVESITMEDSGQTRTLTFPNPEMAPIVFKMRKCRVCGRPFAPQKQLEHMAKISGVPVEELEVCLDCRE